MRPASETTLPGGQHTLFRGYGPFVALVVLVLAMALLAPTVAPEREVTTYSDPGPAAVCDPDRRASATDGCRQ